jgi:hypothetical protein
MSTKEVTIVALLLIRYLPDDQISRLRLQLLTSTSKAEPTAVMLQGIVAFTRFTCQQAVGFKD